ncbi:MAG: prepilin-type N-terminal cleavage/methylation domain-containing protein [Fimbriimonas sp.]|nr:prepilin-type N-terminal cleavage/methylation domain-containing protein [Fimbriimonas sp.]
MQKKAFTLIELLVVIAIIAILAAILFPVFAQAKLAAKGTVSVSNIKQLATASLIYTNDYDDNFVAQFIDPNNGWGWQGSWVMLTLPYMKTYGIVLDPSDNIKLTTHFDSGPKFSYVANAILSGTCGSSSWSWNFHGVVGQNGPANSGSTNWFQNGTRTQTQIGQVASTILFASRFSTPHGSSHAADAGLMEGSFGAWNSILQGASEEDFDATLGNNRHGTLPGQDNYFAAPDPTYKGYLDRVYGGKSPVAYTDGHAKSRQPEQTVDIPGGITDGNAGGCEGKRFLNEWDSLRQ